MLITGRALGILCRPISITAGARAAPVDRVSPPMGAVTLAACMLRSLYIIATSVCGCAEHLPYNCSDETVVVGFFSPDLL